GVGVGGRESAVLAGDSATGRRYNRPGNGEGNEETMIGQGWLRGLAAIASLILWLGLAMTPAAAHRATIGSGDGLPIPSLTHGQMAVIATNRGAILDLADRQVFQDETFYRLRNFIDLQYLHCFWGLVPGSGDEESPFNECSHAYLSATQALLLHMREMKGDQSATRALIKKIEFEMLLNNASLVLCRYSDEPFNTADVIEPHWPELFSHWPSLVSLTGAGLSLLAALLFFVRFLVTPAVPRRQSIGA